MPDLITPNKDYLESYIDICRELREAGIYDFGHNPEDVKKRRNEIFVTFENRRNGYNLPEGYVPSSTFWLVQDGRCIGLGSIRHVLNESLKTFGGHIGYCIRPSLWNKGYGSIQLKLLLREAAELGIPKVRLTCHCENPASAKIMEKNGGIRIASVLNRQDGTSFITHIYSIDTGLQPGVFYNPSKVWLHGSPYPIRRLKPGQILTQDMSLAIRGSNFLYTPNEVLLPGEDLYMPVNSVFEKGIEWRCIREVKLMPVKTTLIL